MSSIDFNLPSQVLLEKLYQHPLIKPRLQTGLGGSTFIDHVIGVLEQAKELQPDTFLEDCYHTLRKEYPLHFASGTKEIMESKNPTYKSCNGF